MLAQGQKVNRVPWYIEFVALVHNKAEGFGELRVAAIKRGDPCLGQHLASSEEATSSKAISKEELFRLFGDFNGYKNALLVSDLVCLR